MGGLLSLSLRFGERPQRLVLRVVDHESHQNMVRPVRVQNAMEQLNPFFDIGAVRYYEEAGGALPPSPFSKRMVIGAAVR